VDLIFIVGLEKVALMSLGCCLPWKVVVHLKKITLLAHQNHANGERERKGLYVQSTQIGYIRTSKA